MLVILNFQVSKQIAKYLTGHLGQNVLKPAGLVGKRDGELLWSGPRAEAPIALC